MRQIALASSTSMSFIAMLEPVGLADSDLAALNRLFGKSTELMQTMAGCPG